MENLPLRHIRLVVTHQTTVEWFLNGAVESDLILGNIQHAQALIEDAPDESSHYGGGQDLAYPTWGITREGVTQIFQLDRIREPHEVFRAD